MGRISLGSEPRTRYVSFFRDNLYGVMVLLVASRLIRWYDHGIYPFRFFDVIVAHSTDRCSYICNFTA